MILNRRTLLVASAAAVPLMASPLLFKTALAAASSAPDFSGVKTVHDFAAQVIGRADLSRAASEVAVQKAARADAREFAGFELMEAKIVIEQLEELGTAVPTMGADTQAALHGIVDSRQGNAFDTAYISAEYENHAFLRDLAGAYLKQADKNSTDVTERLGQQLANVAFFAFTEHAAITHRIAGELVA